MQLRRAFRAIYNRLPFINRYEIHRRPWTFDGRRACERGRNIPVRPTGGLTRIHYACGRNFFPGWLNVDSYRQGNIHGAVFECIDLISRHPFPDASFEYGFAEDFLEHLPQEDSLVFLSECLRTLKPGGVLRLAFPGLEGVLAKHYPHGDWETVNVAKEEAYTRFEHLHFYSGDELSLVARHLGYRTVCFFEFGESTHEPLRGIEQRVAQMTLNTYAELTK